MYFSLEKYFSSVYFCVMPDRTNIAQIVAGIVRAICLVSLVD